MNPRRPALLLLALVALLATGCPQQQTGNGEKKEQLKLVFVGPLTGPVANLGIPARNGAKLAIKELNASGELDVEIVLEEVDTQGDPAQATTKKDRFINDEKVIGVIGPTFSGETKALIPPFGEAGLVMVSPSATQTDLPTLDKKNIFHRVVPHDDIQGKALSDYVTKVLELESLAYVHDNQDYGKAVAEGTRDLLKAAGVEAKLTDGIDPNSQDYSAAVTKVKASGAEASFFGGYYDVGGRLARQLEDAAYTGIFIGTDGVADPSFVTAAGAEAAEGSIITCACRLATKDLPGDLGKFARDYEAEYELTAGPYALEGYDSGKIFGEGIKEGAKTRAAMLAFVEGITTFDGLSKEIAFEANGDVRTGVVFVYTVKDGKLEVLGTIDELLEEAA